MQENDSKLELIKLQYRLLNIFELLEHPNIQGFKVQVNLGMGYDGDYKEENSFELSGPQFDIARKGLLKQLEGRLKELETNYLALLRSTKGKE